ncbi:MAG: hypothetical protein ACYCXN_08675 [Acidimicrobiales bacterium]
MVQVHNHKTGEAIELEQNQRQLHRTEAEARVAGIQMLLGWNEDGVLNGSAERRHYAHGDTNACGTPLEDGRAGRNEPISCLDCLGALGLLGSWALGLLGSWALERALDRNQARRALRG